MQGFDLFISIGEIAGVFVGFGALISLLRDRQSEGRVALHGVIANGLVALVAALIPVTLNEYGFTGRGLWGWSGGAFQLKLIMRPGTKASTWQPLLPVFPSHSHS